VGQYEEPGFVEQSEPAPLEPQADGGSFADIEAVRTAAVPVRPDLPPADINPFANSDGFVAEESVEIETSATDVRGLLEPVPESETAAVVEPEFDPAIEEDPPPAATATVQSGVNPFASGLETAEPESAMPTVEAPSPAAPATVPTHVTAAGFQTVTAEKSAPPTPPAATTKLPVEFGDFEAANTQQLPPAEADGPWGGYREAAPGESAAPQSGPPFANVSTNPVQAAAPPRSAFEAPQDAGVRMHVVGAGENYWSISRTEYGTARYYVALARYNAFRIPDPKRMKPGMKVLIPPVEIMRQRYPDLFPNQPAAGRTASQPQGFFTNAEGQPMYRVGAQDTLTHIAQRHLGRASRWTEIFALNRDRLADPNDLKLGTELRLPADASQVHLITRP
ncbi:MAG: LysM peptidoglycan-binding domain-containing protein, partial [Planctomycetaceae bacterium]